MKHLAGPNAFWIGILKPTLKFLVPLSSSPRRFTRPRRPQTSPRPAPREEAEEHRAVERQGAPLRQPQESAEVKGLSPFLRYFTNSALG